MKAVDLTVEPTEEFLVKQKSSEINRINVGERISSDTNNTLAADSDFSQYQLYTINNNRFIIDTLHKHQYFIDKRSFKNTLMRLRKIQN